MAKDVLFPVPSNQKMNEYLKEIAVICGITKNYDVTRCSPYIRDYNHSAKWSAYRNCVQNARPHQYSHNSDDKPI